MMIYVLLPDSPGTGEAEHSGEDEEDLHGGQLGQD